MLLPPQIFRKEPYQNKLPRPHAPPFEALSGNINRCCGCRLCNDLINAELKALEVKDWHSKSPYQHVNGDESIQSQPKHCRPGIANKAPANCQLMEWHQNNRGVDRNMNKIPRLELQMSPRNIHRRCDNHQEQKLSDKRQPDIPIRSNNVHILRQQVTLAG